MTDGQNAQARWPLVAGAALLALLGGLIALSPRVLIYDERYYMEASWFLIDRFDFFAMMSTPLDVAAGPFYAYLHYFLAPLTELRPPAIRFVNWACLAGVIVANAAIIRRLGHDHGVARAAMVLAVPMIWSTSGLALTELPALLLVSLAVLATVAAVTATPARAWLLLAVAGVCAGLALLARQTYLPALIGFLLVGIGNRRLLAPALLASGLALVVFSPLVIAWGGLTPPWQIPLGGISIAHGVMAFVYLATATLLIAPDYFLTALANRRFRLAGLAAIGLTMLLLGVTGLRLDIASQVIARLPIGLQEPGRLAATLVMSAIASGMAVATLFHLWQERGNSRLLALGLLTMMMTGTAAGIVFQFSSRYVLGAFPFALLMLQPWVAANRWAALRLAIGALLGCASLTAYYRNATPFNAKDYIFAPREIVEKMRTHLAEQGDAGRE